MILNDTDINYIEYGKKTGSKVILLHGWGQNIEMMKMIGDYLSLKHYIYILDLPGFGNSEEPNFSWEISDYSDMLNNFVKDKNIKNLVLIGHSFGGRIAMKYAADNKVSKLVLFAAPFEKRIQKETIKLKILKLMKKIPVINKLENFVKKHSGSRDYRNASSIMRKILVNTVNTDLTLAAKNIKCPTLLIWGSNDEETSIEEGRKLESLIKDSALIEYENGTHYAYLEQITKTNSILSNFLGSEE